MNIFKWLLSKINHVRKHRLEIKVGPLFERLIHLRYATEAINIKDYLDYEYYSFNEDFKFRLPNEACMYMIVITDKQELVFIKRTWGNEWLKLVYHNEQLLKALAVKIHAIAIARKIKSLIQS